MRSSIQVIGQTWEDFAADAQRIVDRLAERLARTAGRQGKLRGASKQRLLDAIERLRRTVLKWLAWAYRAAARP